MGKLIEMIDDWRDRHGRPSEASIGRAIGVSDGTVNAWRRRGIRQLPDPETLRNLAEFLNVPIEQVVLAAAFDAGYRERTAKRTPDEAAMKHMTPAQREAYLATFEEPEATPPTRRKAAPGA